MGFALLNKMAPELKLKYLLKIFLPEPLAQILNNFTEVFLIMPSAEIVHIVLLGSKLGSPQGSRVSSLVILIFHSNFQTCNGNKC